MHHFINGGLLVLALVAGDIAPAAGAALSPQTIHVDIRGFQFVPAHIDAHVGDTIEWTNRDFAPHTATESRGRWKTPTLKAGATGHIVVTKSGTFAYSCQFHPQMKGAIIVTGSAAPSPPPNR
jgi:plastocyanin